MKQFNTLVYIGRFQPFHKAHLETIKIASKQCKNLIIIVGSNSAHRTLRNPFTSDERIEMIKGTIDEFNEHCKDDESINVNLLYETVVDCPEDDSIWCGRVKRAVEKDSLNSENVGIIGHVKDDSSFYLKLFPEWEHVNVDKIYDIDASSIRNSLFTENMNSQLDDYLQHISVFTHEFLKRFTSSSHYEKLNNEFTLLFSNENLKNKL
jgi:bifunctional NMN adenylyltransferase/nudix hydrolase